MKKFATIALTLAMAATAACASATTVGICQLVQHEALDAATQGFKDALTEKMPDVKFDEQNAAGDAGDLCHHHQQVCRRRRGFDSRQRDRAASGRRFRDGRYSDSRHVHHRLRDCAGHEGMERHDGHQRLRHERSCAAGTARPR